MENEFRSPTHHVDFQTIDGRWLVPQHFASEVTAERAAQSFALDYGGTAIVQNIHEDPCPICRTRQEEQPSPRVVVTHAGNQVLLPGCELAPVKKGANAQARMF